MVDMKEMRGPGGMDEQQLLHRDAAMARMIPTWRYFSLACRGITLLENAGVEN